MYSHVCTQQGYTLTYVHHIYKKKKKNKKKKIINKAQIRPCLEYGSSLWRGATLEEIQKRALKLIEESTLSNSLDSLAPRRV